MAGWAEAIVQRFNTYTEVSPSGRGVKLWLKGRLPGTRNKVRLSATEAVEVYATEQFFTVTGQQVPGTPCTIASCQAELDTWYAEVFTAPVPTLLRAKAQQAPHEPVDLDDQELVEQVLRSKNSAKFARLWTGDTSDYHGDTSQADMALCGMLAFWTGWDAERIDRLFRQSGLYREKWERAGYRERTIEQAPRTTTSTYTPPHRKRQDRRTYHTLRMATAH